MANLLQHLQQLAGNAVNNVEHPTNIPHALVRLLSSPPPSNPLTAPLRETAQQTPYQIRLLPGTAAATYNGVPYAIPNQTPFPLRGGYSASVNSNPSRYQAIPMSAQDELARFPQQSQLTPIGQ